MKFDCAVCGKHVERLYMDEWIYKKFVYGHKKDEWAKTLYFCGWNCMRKYEKEQEVKRHGKRT